MEKQTIRSYREAAEAFDKNYEKYITPEFLMRLNLDRNYCRTIMNLKPAVRFKAFNPVVTATEEGDTMLTFLSCRGKAGYKSTGMNQQTLMRYEGERGPMYVTSADGFCGAPVKSHIFFTEHMFERYRERVLGNEDIPMEKVMKELIPSLNHVSILDKSHPKHKNSVFCLCEQCVFLGTSYKADNIVVFATCVSYDMLKTTQIDIANDLAPIVRYMDEKIPNSIYDD